MIVLALVSACFIGVVIGWKLALAASYRVMSEFIIDLRQNADIVDLDQIKLRRALQMTCTKHRHV